MPRNKPKTAKKYDDIRSDYNKWSSKKYKGVKIYTDKYIFTKLAEKYYLSTRTIENVVFYRVGYNYSLSK